jgi:hypothetical protein
VTRNTGLDELCFLGKDYIPLTCTVEVEDSDKWDDNRDKYAIERVNAVSI